MAASERSPKIDTKLIRELANILKEGELGEIEVEQGPLRVRVSTASGMPPMPMAAPPQQVMAAPAVAATSAPVSAPGQSPEESKAPADAIPSPMVGTVYFAPEPGAAPFVTIGQTVKKGDTLMLVEAMKTFNPVTSPTDGTVKAILVDDGQPVEYGEPLAVVA